MSVSIAQPLSANRSFGGWVKRFEHRSEVLDCDMVFGAYLPPQAEQGPVPALWWLSGLTCTDENFMQKAGAQRVAAELGMAIICPDTSPRGTDLPGEHDDWDFGSGAGFYVNATQEPWSRHYRMYDYVTQELPRVAESVLPLDGRPYLPLYFPFLSLSLFSLFLLLFHHLYLFSLPLPSLPPHLPHPSPLLFPSVTQTKGK